MTPMDQQQMAAMVKEKLHSREWWLLVPIGEEGNAFCAEIEQTYYSGEANTDFHLVMDSQWPLHWFYLAKKSRMSAQQMADLYPGSPDQNDELREHLLERDFLLLGSGEYFEGYSNAFLLWFEENIGGDIS